MIIGRREEIKILAQIRQSKEAEFLAVYGRRRVGKTFLIREYFSDKGVYLETAGVKGLSLTEQLENFSDAFSKVFLKNLSIKVPRSWKEAFELLTEQIKSAGKNKKVIIFFDELPWLASSKSGFIPALDYYWNLYWSRLPNLILVVCGSAASWMLEHVVHAKGGLYNRVTKRMLLEAFSLKETADFLKARTVNLNKKQILDLYMVVGGIPFYLKEVTKGQTTAQIIDSLCFQKNGILYTEFNNVFRSLFDNAETNLQIIREIAKSGNSLSRERLIEITSLSSGGGLNRRLEELEASEFIRCYVPLGKKNRERFYRIIDEYTLFYLKWIDPLIRSGTFTGEKGYWQKMLKTPEKLVWSGYAFESVCLKHIHQISQALGLEKIPYLSGSWRYIPARKSKEQGAQIDLLFDRGDDAVTVGEIKYSETAFVIDKSYAKNLQQKIEAVQENYPSKKNPTKKQIFLAVISTFGLKKNVYFEDLVQNEVFLEDLFV